MRTHRALVTSGLAVFAALLCAPAAEAAFQGQNGLITFRSDRDDAPFGDIFVMNPDGTGQKNLTILQPGPAIDSQPTWSPNGLRIVSSRATFTQAGLNFMDADGGNAVTISTVAGGHPTFAPDGLRVAAHGNDASGSSQIFTLAIDGSNLTQITTAGFNSFPTWAPDGSWIAFHRASTAANTDSTIFSIRPDGTGLTQLTTTPGDFVFDWSPDSTRLLFSRDMGGGNRDVWVMNADGTGQMNLTNNPAFDNYGVFSPDGTMIAFQRLVEPGNSEIFTMNADGTDQTRITFAAGNDTQPNWGVRAVPEPPSIALAVLGGMALVGGVRLRRERPARS